MKHLKKFEDIELIKEYQRDSISVISKEIHRLIEEEGYSLEEVKTMMINLVDKYSDFQGI